VTSTRRHVTLARLWGVTAIALVVALLALRACLHTPPLANLERLPTEAADPRDPPGTVVYQGSLHIARGGPVIVGFQTQQPARLVVGTGDLVRGDASAAKELVGRGLVKDRIILMAGPVAIRFAAPPGARLVWSPVGRRGDPEYVPASSLSPLLPERAQFSPWAGAAPLDGVIALGLLAVIAITALVLARRRLRLVPRELWLAFGGVLVLGLGVRWIGLSDFGQTWDEDVNWAAGRNYVTNVLALDISGGSWIWNYEHPPVMKYLAGVGAQLADGFGPARALSALWMALGCALLVPIATRLYNLRTGVLAGLIATLLPHLVGHGQIVGHESPTVLWWSLGILLALGVCDPPAGRVARNRPVAPNGPVAQNAPLPLVGHGEDNVEVAPSPRAVRLRLVAVGVVIGVAVASRFINGLLGVVCLLIVILQAPSRRWLRTTLEAAAIMPVTALATLYAVWPRLWSAPIEALQASLAKLSHTHAPEPFLGAMTSTPGYHYFVVYLVATLPLTILAGTCGWLVRAGRERTTGSLLVLLWLVLPLAVVLSPVRQDGVRYVLPCVMALAVMSAAGWEWFTSRLAQRVPRAHVAWTALVVVYLLVTLARFSPYYLDYYGEHVGGPRAVQAKQLLETAWWGEGVAEAVDHVNRHARPGARVYRNCIEPVHLAWFRQDLWPSLTHSLADAEWVVAYSPASKRCPVPPGLERVYVVDVQGAVLAVVYQRR
jgi:4-amino-4-deoxy-L-arabinose transferase-like glycosyltransferase